MIYNYFNRILTIIEDIESTDEEIAPELVHFSVEEAIMVAKNIKDYI